MRPGLDRFVSHTALGPDVWRASDRLGGPDVIVKRAVAGAARDALEREVNLLLDLDGHPASRAVHAISRHDDGTLTVVLEDVQGTPLDRLAPSAQSARAIATQVLDALHALESRGLVHGDLKPAHVLVDVHDVVRLLDLGLVTPLGATARGGTHGFLAPELLAGATTSAQTELYAFARTLERAGLRGLDARLDGLLDACVAIDPRARPPSIEVALAQLDALPRRSTRSVEHEDPLTRLLTELQRAIDADDGRTVVITSAAGGGRTHLAQRVVHRNLGARSLARIDARVLVGGLAATAPLFDTPHTEDRERLVERAHSRAMDAGVRWLIDGADAASPDLLADLVTAARATFGRARGSLIIVGADPGLVRALRDASPSLLTMSIPLVEEAELARALEHARVDLDASGRAEILTRTDGRRGTIHRALHALSREGVSLEAALRRVLGTPVKGSEPDETARRSSARDAQARDAPRAVLAAIETQDDDEALRLAAWAHGRVGSVAQALTAIDRVAAARRSTNDRADRARFLERLGRFDEALDEARSLLDEPELSPDVLAVALIAGATSAHRRGQLELARALIDRAPSTLDAIARARLDTIASDVALARGDRADAVACAERARERAESLGDRGLLALVEARLGAIAGLGGDPARALSHHARALAHAEAAGDLSALPPYLGNLATAHHVLGHVDAAIAAYERAAGLAERLGRAASLATALVNLAGLHQLLRADEEAAALLERADDVAQRAGIALVVAQVALVRAELARDGGDVRAARERAAAARTSFTQLGASRQALEASLALAEIDALEGRANDLLERTMSTELEEAGLSARASVLRATRALRDRRTSDACTFAEEALEHARAARQLEQELHALAFLARSHAELGTGAADVHTTAFRRRLGDLAARTPASLRERFVRRWTENVAPTAPLAAPSTSTAGSRAADGLGIVGQRLVSLVRRTLLEDDESRLLEAALDEAIAASGAERGFLLLKRGGKRAEIAVARNLDRDTIKQPRFRMSRSVADRVLATNEPLVTASATEDPELAGSRSILDLGLRSIVCVPVRSPSGVVGALYLDHRFERGRFDSEVSETAQAFADVIGLALENARLHRASEARVREAESSRAAAEERASTHLLEADRMAALLASRATLGSHGTHDDAPGGIVGRAPAIRAAIELVRKVARSDLAVTIEGESGTGKELFARLAHDESPRRTGPFLAINCGALPEPLLESELFGHMRGAFTGATRDHAGLLRSAQGGTVFLDEVGEMPQSMQVRLLRALQEREVRPVGGRAAIAIDVRIVTATHRRLADEVERGTFRRDLYFRLAGVAVSLPPLRERASDIPLLASAILDRLAPPRRKLSRRALASLLAHPFPGNVRELEQALRRACAIAESDTIEPDDLGLATPSERSLGGPRVELSARRVERALTDAAGNRTNAARALGVSRATLHRFLVAHPPAEPGRRGRPRA